MRTLYIDCGMGAAGDMLTAALLELLPDRNAFLRKLNPQARTAFIGRYYYMDSVAEVARYCGMSESKAKSMLHRTRKKLKDYLEKEGFTV